MTDPNSPSFVMSVLRETGLPAAYRQWAPAKPPPLPYVLFFRAARQDVCADNRNYLKKAHWCAELYSDSADFESMAAVEAALEAHGIAYSASEGGGEAVSAPLTAIYYFDTLGAR